MRLSPTFSLYIARQFLFWLAAVFISLSVFILMIDLVELLRRGGGRADFGFGLAQFGILIARRSQIGPCLGQVRFGLTQLGLHLQQLGLRIGFFIHNGDVITSGRLDSLFGCRSFFIQYLLAPVLRFGLLDPSGIGSYGGFRPFDIGGRGVDVSRGRRKRRINSGFLFCYSSLKS